jgi:polyisoprenyl-teichoic acid--peptidoglycan teichoic acid transferase
MPRTGRGVLWRGFVAGFVVVACAAGATATEGLLQVKNIGDKLHLSGSLPTAQLALPAPGKPETLLLIGVDCRGSECKGGYTGNTDTMMLLRINDNSSTINALSIPRDLWVNIPDHGFDKVNAAYSEGGETLLIKTLRANVFPQLKVNHVLIVDFAGFANLINEIGCVYAQVDHRYYNHSSGIPGTATDYSSIDIEPGYQKLCGGSGSDLGGANTALAFVRFRHNDSDFVRESRQQDFLRWAKQNFSTSELLSKENQLLTEVGNAVQTDANLQKTSYLIDLFNLAIHADGSTVKSFSFPYGPAIGATSNISFSESASEATYRRFLKPTPLKPGQSASAPVTTTTATSKTKTKNGKSKGQSNRHATSAPHVPPLMAADPDDGNAQAAKLGNNVGLPIYYPRNIPDDYSYCFSEIGNCNIGYEPTAGYAGAYPRAYVLRDTSDKPHNSYVMTLVESYGGETETATGQYVTVQGTTWTDPPILNGTHTVRRVGHKTLDIYGQAGKVSLVAWHRGRDVYWIANTLQNAVPNPQMIAMAESFARAKG